MSEIMWAIDVEGSGKSPPEIVELAIAEMDGLSLTGRSKHWRFRPKNGISPIAARIHGIWDEDVVDAPDLEDVVDDVLLWLEDKAIVGHNVKVELDILSPALEGWEPAAAYDTLKIARRLLSAEDKHGLGYLGSKLDLSPRAEKITGGKAHSAPFDAVLSALLLDHMLRDRTEEDQRAILADADILGGAQGLLL
ncbi:DNA polymerase III subunit epsilon [Novosphingobium barchaimii LL02]|uniref:DNA polymerase III subunit epsilon n=1 Tax=Novosphingobium barchaimii LL02 TaxID=1114963 RepID=A0A0J8B0F5_9SPHN|nr:3'-5' exonuclease [Novosphingobium barchaimii]KMS59870.1 DNA polymerase III subunit epsilon [Novosphingobium barchaimii LL02]